MYLSATLITIATLSFFVEASPTLSRSGFAIPILKRTQVHDANGVVDFAMLQRDVHHSIAKLHRGFRAYKRNTGASHPSAPQDSEKRDIGSEPLNDTVYYWYGSISVGTPAKNFTVSFDTGSSDLFLPSTTCDRSCKGHTLYNISESSSAYDLKISFTLGLGDGSGADGQLYTDDVTIGGYTAEDQTFGGATGYSDGLQYPKWLPDGVLGLGFPGISAFSAPPVFHNLIAQGTLPTKSFGLCSTELYIGGTNDKLHKGDFTHVRLTDEGFWQTKIGGLYVNGKQIAGTIDTIVDSGTTMIIGDIEAVQAVYAQIPGSVSTGGGYYNIPCSFNSTIIFQFGAANFTLQPQTFNLGTTYENRDDPNGCLGGIAASDDYRFWILGDVFLKNVYSEFDVGNKRIGFATLA